MKVGEHRTQRKPEGCLCERPVALMLTHERPGLLLATVKKFWDTTEGVPLHVFDDGSQSEEKKEELRVVEKMGALVIRMPHQGFARSWHAILPSAKITFDWKYDSMVMLEDDIVFASGWLETLQKMQRGIIARGLKQGCVSCFRPHVEPQSTPVDLNGVEAYQSMAHTWHANLVPMEVFEQLDVLDESVCEVMGSRRGLGLDVYFIGNLAHRLQRISFVSMQSWVAHVGYDSSVVKEQGFGSCEHPGVNLVGELSALGEAYEREWKRKGEGDD